MTPLLAGKYSVDANNHLIGPDKEDLGNVEDFVYNG